MAAEARSLIRDPRAVPVVGTDAHLPALDAGRLALPHLRRSVAAAVAWQAPIGGDVARAQAQAAGQALRPASVLVPLVTRPQGLQVLLTRRTDHLRDHAGQISFPGGRAEPQDADAVATALREAQEEVGLSAQHLEVLGPLPPYATITRYDVTPVVALVAPEAAPCHDPGEVAEVFEVPLAFLMSPAHHQRHQFEWEGQRRQFLSMPWGPDAAQPQRYFIWGATAAMLRNFYHLLHDTPLAPPASLSSPAP
ncbi:CoA pyrophosphatase [Ideonella livida]|uniref:CoA pyrophosphatase n=1 Tax=Ideonella livida TaxID=2707176 RepID=A0A7C9TLA2_9BURK|nr:CoA pyrophosphatase [Ideonella livida]NDY92324.1 CoA pyrophosphatase [Ideonella livida]